MGQASRMGREAREEYRRIVELCEINNFEYTPLATPLAVLARLARSTQLSAAILRAATQSTGTRQATSSPNDSRSASRSRPKPTAKTQRTPLSQLSSRSRGSLRAAGGRKAVRPAG